MIPINRLVALLFALTVPALGSARTALDGLPLKTTLVLRIADCSELTRKFKESPFYELKDSPHFSEFVAEFKREIEEEMSDVRQELGFDPLEILKFIEGEAVVAVGDLDTVIGRALAEMTGMPGPDAKVKPADLPLIIAADAGASAPKVREHLGKILALVEKEGAHKEVEDFRGGKIQTIVNAKKESEDDIEKLFFGELGSTFLVSLNRPYLEATMGGMSGSTAMSLGNDDDFAVTNLQLGKDTDVQLFVNVAGLVEAIRKNLQAMPIYQMFWGLVESKLIGRGLKYFGSGGTVQADGLQAVSFFNTGGARDGILGLLDGPSFSPQSSAKGVPPSAELLKATTFNFQRFYQLVREVANMALSMTQGNPGFDVEQMLEAKQIKIREVVNALGSKLYYYSSPSKGADPKTPTTESLLGNVVVGIELKNREPVKELLDSLPALLGEGSFVQLKMKSEKFKDHDLYRFEEAGEATLALLDDRLVFASREGSVKDLIQRRGKQVRSLVDTAGFQLQMKNVPNEVASMGYVNEGYFKESFKPAATILEAEGLPDLEPVLDVFGTGAGYSIWTDKGYFYKSWVHYRKKTKTPKQEVKPEKKAEERKL